MIMGAEDEMEIHDLTAWKFSTMTEPREWGWEEGIIYLFNP